MGWLTITSQSPDDTSKFAIRLGQLLQPGDVLALSGELGSGKTTFTQGVARALGVREYVNSPTFTLIKHYDGRLPLYHMDMYRLSSLEEAESLGLDEYFYGDGICVVEWPNRLGDLLPHDALHISIEVTSPTGRRFQLRAERGRGSERIEELTHGEMAGD